eukprot:15366496-Ditylum_brightwellii.AAC.1
MKRKEKDLPNGSAYQKLPNLRLILFCEKTTTWEERKPDMKYNHYIEQILKWGALYATHFCNNTAYWEAE